jgi:hypothetical protein
MESGQLSEEAKKIIEGVYLSLNPAQLKRQIETKTQKLYRQYEEKKRGQEATPFKKANTSYG